MIPLDKMSQAELGAYVQTHLAKKEIDVVLSGGAAVAFYTSGKYVSLDLDLVNRYFAKRKALRCAMEEIGFKEKGRYFEHPNVEYIIEFPPGPLSMGNDPNVKVDEISLKTGLLQIISPTDCVKDRLAWYYHTGDVQCLKQAILVSKERKIEIEEIRRWSEAEGRFVQFLEIERRICH